MNCDRDHFYDQTTSDCLPCKDSCHPNRVETRTECFTHCKGYLQRIGDSQVTEDQWHQPPSADSTLIMVLITLLIALFLLVFIAAIAATAVIKVRLWQPYRKGRMKQDYVEVTTETTGIHGFHEDSLKKDLSRNDRLSSQCQSDLALRQILGKAVSSPTNIYVNSRDKFFSSSQETHFQNDCKRTPLKSIQTVDVVPSTAVKQPIQAVLSLDLQEDGYDFVEQACALPPEGNADTDDGSVIVDPHISKPEDRRNYDITAYLQRLPWIRQFWWDTEGAKIAVDESHRKNGKELIKQMLALEGIPSQDFSFEIIDPSNLFCAV